MAVKIQVLFWFVSSEDGCSMDLWNIGTLPQHYMASQARMTWLEGYKYLEYKTPSEYLYNKPVKSKVPDY
jgi:hypothetical protein